MTQFYAYIYRDCSRNFEPIYCGKGCGKRAYRHLEERDRPPKEKEHTKFMQRLRNMKAVGVEPVIQIFKCESEELALLFEEEAIDKYGRIDLGTGPLYNRTAGGQGMSGCIVSEDTRKKISKSNTGKIASFATRQKMSNANRGENNPMFGKQSALVKGKNNPMFGKLHTEHSKKKNSDAIKALPKVICQHCKKEGGIGAMHRWHFDNCKFKDTK